MSGYMYELNEHVKFAIQLELTDFDAACEMAYRFATRKFCVEKLGDLANVKGANLSTHTLVVDFVAYRRDGNLHKIGRHRYCFEAWVCQNGDEGNEECPTAASDANAG